MRNLFFTTEHTEGTEKIESSFTTETQRHRDTEKKDLK